MKKLSVAIITLNEEKNIGRCLASVVDLADEVLVIDSLSTDRTEEICRSFGVRFVPQPFLGYIEQKQFAVERCTYDLVLSLDADEALSTGLQKAIQKEKEKGFPEALYSMNRLTNYCGQWIHHSGWYPDTKLRLFDRRMAKWGGQNPHDKVIPFGRKSQVKHLTGDLLHYSYYTVEAHWKQADKFATIAAKAMAGKNKKASLPFALLKAAAKFLRNYVIKVGFLDGRNGFIISKISAWETFQKYRRIKNFRRTNPVQA